MESIIAGKTLSFHFSKLVMLRRGGGDRACNPRMLFNLTTDLFHSGKQFKYSLIWIKLDF